MRMNNLPFTEAREWYCTINRLVLVLGIFVILIGFAGVISYPLEVPMLRQFIIQPRPARIYPEMNWLIALNILLLGIGILTILQTTPHRFENSRWFKWVQVLSCLIPSLIGLWLIQEYLFAGSFNWLRVIFIDFPEIPGSFISAISLFLGGGSLALFLTQKKNQTLLIFGTNIPSLLIMSLCLFALFGYAINLPSTYNFYVSLHSSISYIFFALAILIASIPYHGLLLPAVVKERKVRVLSWLSILLSLLILIQGGYNTYRSTAYQESFETVADTVAYEEIYSILELGSVLLATLIFTMSLRSLYYYCEAVHYSKLQQQAREREATLRQIMQAVYSNFDLEVIFQVIVTELGRYLNVDRCYIAHYNPNTGSITPPAKEYLAHSKIQSIDTLETSSLWQITKDVSKKQPLQFNKAIPLDAVNLSPELKSKLNALSIQSCLSCIIAHRGQPKAILTAHQTTQPRIWSESDQEMLEEVAQQAALAISQAELYQQEQKAREEAMAMSQKKSQLLANMSHEIRTPLNAIIGYSEMLEQGYAGALNTAQKKYASNVSISSHHLLSLINDILDLSKVEAGKVELFKEDIRLEPFLYQIHSMLEEMAARQNITIRYQIAPDVVNVYADPNRLRQIFLNLLSNALKFNKENGKITVQVRRSDDRNWIVVDVSDTGIGIPQDKIPKLFDEFFQVGSPKSRPMEGTGLGLSLSKRLVELHGGQIYVESQEGQGSKFTFTLPG